MTTFEMLSGRKISKGFLSLEKLWLAWLKTIFREFEDLSRNVTGPRYIVDDIVYSIRR